MAKCFDQSYVPTEKGTDLSFTSFLDVRGHGQVKGNRRARAEKEVSWENHKIGWPSLGRQVWQAWAHNQEVKPDQNVEQELDQPAPHAELTSSIVEPTGLPAVIYIEEGRESGK